MPYQTGRWTRRRFLQTAGTLSAFAGIHSSGFAAENYDVSIVADPSDNIASAPEARWAADELEHVLLSQGVKVLRCEKLSETNSPNLCILAADAAAPRSAALLKRAGVTVKPVPEALCLLPAKLGGRNMILACGYDPRGLVYALLELADRVRYSTDAIAAIASVTAHVEQPANEVRSITKLFTSNVEDSPWYNDTEMWPDYLTMLATQRFNRFNLAFGIGYDFLRHVTDAYFLFTYPFLLSVPGYNVRVPQLPDAERDKNLEMLRFISEQTVLHGMEFHIGLWMHGYEWIDSLNASYVIEGITKENHASYCRDAVRLLLKTCPAISGITFRIHGESGVQEGSYEFWKTVFDGVATCGREVKLDMHTKGMDQTMTDIALATRQPVSMSPKFWGEHLGMTYHQTDIREFERPKPSDEIKTGLMKLSAGSRSFLRYGYGDLMREDRRWTIVHRIWPGTQRILLSGDPVTAAAYSRCFSFCGSNGVEICEPLSFKGRRGSGIAGSRCAYEDVTLNPRWDWQKYLYTYRIWGRLLYNPETESSTWQRMLQSQFGAASQDAETALANASRILPAVTTAYAPSAGNNTYWPEMYWNQSFVDAAYPGPYGDSIPPKVFDNASPFDPQLFSRMDEYATELLKNSRSGKYSPVEVAQWIEIFADNAFRSLKQADAKAARKGTPEYRRFAIDVAIQAGLGYFFAAKFRSGVLFAIYEQSGDSKALEASLMMYRKARDSWAGLANTAKGIYLSDITVGEEPQQRGHWLDRLSAIDRDIEGITLKLSSAQVTTPQPEVEVAIREAMGRIDREIPAIAHYAPARFQPGQPLELQLTAPDNTLIDIYYRHVNQAERYQKLQVEKNEHGYRVVIPVTYTMTDYPIEYYFQIQTALGHVSLYPGFSEALTNQPYFVVRRG